MLRLHRRSPKVQITLHETTQRHALDMLQSTGADVGILSEPPRGGIGVVQLLSDGKIALSLIAPPHHPLLARRLVTLDVIARYPLVHIDPYLSWGWNVKPA